MSETRKATGVTFFVMRSYNPDTGGWVLETQQEGMYIYGNSPKKLFDEILCRSSGQKCFVYDPWLSLHRYLFRVEWDKIKLNPVKGTILRAQKDNIWFINSKDFLNDNGCLETKDIINLALNSNDGELPISLAGMVLNKLNKRDYLDFECWMNYKAYDLYKGLKRGALMGYNKALLGQELDFCDAWDIKSSYPYILYTQKFPSRYIEVHDGHGELSTDILYMNDYWVAEIAFNKLKPKSTTVIDWLADEEVMQSGIGTFTSVDFYMLKEDYDFEINQILKISIAHKDDMKLLPQNLRDFVMENFTLKETIDKETHPEEYETAKRNVNIIFGLFYKVPQEQESTYRSMLKEKRRPSCIGFWAVSYARYALWRALKIKPKAVVYWNTDGFVTTEDISKEMQQINMCRQIEGTQLGQWVNEHSLVECIVLGNNQIYIDGKLKCAGLSSVAGNRYLTITNQKPYVGMIIPPECTDRWGVDSEGNIIKLSYTLGGGVL